MRAYFLVDLGFGDAGKGLLTDLLARERQAGLVVRYNGGAQAGHNVVTADGRQHTFAQFGSASFLPGVRTYLSADMVVHPTALLAEAERLQRLGAPDLFSRLRIHPQALLITPFHQAANRIRELARGDGRHGSCGVGVGETYEDALRDAEGSLRAEDLCAPGRLRSKLRAIRSRKQAELAPLAASAPAGTPLAHEWEYFRRPEIIDAWIEAAAPLARAELLGGDELLADWLAHTPAAIFEGAQGVLLDADAGFHPYTTWSRCTTANARALIERLAPQAERVEIGITRAYTVRHGPGPLPTETDALHGVISEHNQRNAWQGGVRYGWWDAVLLRYALQVNGGVDCLAVTHLDVLPRLDAWRYCPAYASAAFAGLDFERQTDEQDQLRAFRLPGAWSLAQRERFTQELLHAQPCLRAIPADETAVLAAMQTELNLPVAVRARGPAAGQATLTAEI